MIYFPARQLLPINIMSINLLSYKCNTTLIFIACQVNLLICLSIMISAVGAALGLSLATNLDSVYAGTIFALIGAAADVVLRNLPSPWLKDFI